MEFRREWSMPSADTFSMKPVAELLGRWLRGRERVLDPFARNSQWADVTNDLNPATTADSHVDAIEFLDATLERYGPLSFDAVLLDPPYSPRQIAEVYKSVGRPVTMEDTQNARLYRECKERMTALLKADGVAVTCAWNSGGFGIKRGFSLKEVLLVPCGGAHNDFIVTVEVKDGPHEDRTAEMGGNLSLLF